MSPRDDQTRAVSTGSVIILTICLVLSGCSNGDNAAGTSSSSSSSATATSSTSTTPDSTTTSTSGGDDLAGFDVTAETIPAAQATGTFAGYWSGDWGNLAMRVDADGGVVASYSHDAGDIVGTINDDGIMVGWWCEAPSRSPDNDAGTVEMRLVEGSNGAAIDGRWTYGEHTASKGWRDDWDIAAKTSSEPPAELTARLDKVSSECIPPS